MYLLLYCLVEGLSTFVSCEEVRGILDCARCDVKWTENIHARVVNGRGRRNMLFWHVRHLLC